MLLDGIREGDLTVLLPVPQLHNAVLLFYGLYPLGYLLGSKCFDLNMLIVYQGNSLEGYFRGC